MRGGRVISEELISWRKKHKLSLYKASTLFGVSAVSLGHWEKGRPCGMFGPILILMDLYDQIQLPPNSDQDLEEWDFRL